MDIPIIVSGGRQFYCPSELPEEETPTKEGVEWGGAKNKNGTNNHRMIIGSFTAMDINELQGIEYEGRYKKQPIKGIAYEVNDVYGVFGVHPNTLLSYVITEKIYGFWKGDRLYVDLETLRVFYIRSHKQ